MPAAIARTEPGAAIEQAYARDAAADGNPVWIHRVPRAEALERAVRCAAFPLR